MFKTSLTIDDIHAVIDRKDFYVFPGTTLTVCCLTLKDGFSVIGESACLDATHFDPEIGRKVAEENATENVWKIEGYLQNYKNKQGAGAIENAVIIGLKAELANVQAELDKTAADVTKFAKAAADAMAAADAAMAPPADPVPAAPPAPPAEPAPYISTP